ncbi:Gfo/Idh/MocA family protein [Nonomuraea sp. NPDC050556]|uniref:Gfo/Idh/MocA family protein n=1 Tax=Nonomuraea sp. NPDC050556 TaxID=3364369 RepID=UPI0037A47678
MSPRIGIVGPGAIAELHVSALVEAGAVIAAVAGPDRDQATSLARGAAVYGTADELYGHPGLDAVVVASPHAFHADQTLAALRAGLHVLCEIPVALTVRDAEAVARTARSTGKHAAVAHTLRFCEPYRKARELAGDARHVVARTLMLRQDDTGMRGRKRGWTDDVLWHHGAHTVDAALWLLDAGEAEVFGTTGPVWPGSGRPMDVGAVLRAPDGDLATIALSYHARTAAKDLTIITETRTLHLRDGVLTDDRGRILADGGDRWEADGLARQDRDFLDAITHGRRPGCTVDDVLPAMRILDRLGGPR